MCINNPEELGATSKLTSGYGYKVFTRTRSGRLNFPIYKSREPVPVGKWLSALARKAVGKYPMPGYLSGFHIFLNKKRANAWRDPGEVVRRVMYKDARLIGRFDGGRVIVADQLYVPRMRMSEQ